MEVAGRSYGRKEVKGQDQRIEIVLCLSCRNNVETGKRWCCTLKGLNLVYVPPLPHDVVPHVDDPPHEGVPPVDDVTLHWSRKLRNHILDTCLSRWFGLLLEWWAVISLSYFITELKFNMIYNSSPRLCPQNTSAFHLLPLNTIF